MTKIKNNSPLVNITSTDQVKFVGDIPTCALTGDCLIDETNLTYLISILLTRYCVENNVVDADLSSVDLTCLLTSNPDILLPSDITIETLSVYYKDHLCALYSKISDLEDVIDSLKGITCLNDIVQLNQNDSILIDPLFNDLLDEVTGTVLVTIITSPINGTTSITANQITYTPDTDFFGNDQITYQVTKGGYTCTAKISIKVNEVISNETVTEIVIEQITTILQSDEYWDIGLPIGTKISVNELNLASFNLVGGSWGAGSGKWSKWAICNGNNGTDDEKGLTTRGFDVNDIDYSDSSSNNTNGSDSVTLIKNNIPSHKHLIGLTSVNDTGTSQSITDLQGKISADNKDITNLQAGDRISRNWSGSGSDFGDSIVWANSGDGSNNNANEDNLPISPTAINIRNVYFTEIKIQKIL